MSPHACAATGSRSSSISAVSHAGSGSRDPDISANASISSRIPRATSIAFNWASRPPSSADQRD
ncbi:hypothetical protein [Sphingomonas hankookensis]|uniref:hypothetical protein n=1 Tax=Sphingomonas hankookensis TaxID=563996 RepID=UPI003D30384D